MNSAELLENTFLGLPGDRTPILGGWISCPDHICHIAGVDLDAYWEDPVTVSVTAYKKLGMDGLIDIVVPRSKDDFRVIDANTYVRADTGLSLEDTLARIEEMPSAAEIEGAFDFDGEYVQFRLMLEKGRAICGDMVYMPAQWGAGAKLQWYDDFGYENFFIIVGAYPEHAKKLMEIGGARGYLKCRLVAQAVRDGLYPHAILLGEDICSQRGPMVSPEFLREFYAPQLARGLGPLLELGCRPVWHSDGDVRLLVDMLIDCGVKGFQGFQPECGMTLEFMLEHRTKEGEPLLIFGPMAVTTELPVLSPAEIRRRVKEVVQLCKGRANLVLFTSNTINPDIPLENIIAMYEAILN
ncbi:MAG: hypothetical protein LBQ38_00150 [Spirochaetaceae bacterium]|jgi:hypothetical protein|nr:hypothetical protein [Spirochaetaceae bacterium]